MGSRARILGPRVASAQAARLVLTEGLSVFVGNERRSDTPARLYGTERLVAGRTLIVTEPLKGAITLKDNEIMATALIEGFVVDVMGACAQVIPRRVLGPKGSTERMRLQIADPVCLQGGDLIGRLTIERPRPGKTNPTRGVWLR